MNKSHQQAFLTTLQIKTALEFLFVATLKYYQLVTSDSFCEVVTTEESHIPNEQLVLTKPKLTSSIYKGMQKECWLHGSGATSKGLVSVTAVNTGPGRFNIL